ncbi:hypothetical protein DESC_920058 [Desulfosarcina cetonica]|nr:hypothetical protein DESC_920058 [Desulfosarcina cetonica]
MTRALFHPKSFGFFSLIRPVKGNQPDREKWGQYRSSENGQNSKGGDQKVFFHSADGQKNTVSEADINFCQCTTQTIGNDIVVVVKGNQQNENDDGLDDQTEHATHQKCIDGTLGNFAYPISAQIGAKRYRDDDGQQVQHPQEGTRSSQREAEGNQLHQILAVRERHDDGQQKRKHHAFDKAVAKSDAEKVKRSAKGEKIFGNIVIRFFHDGKLLNLRNGIDDIFEIGARAGTSVTANGNRVNIFVFGHVATLKHTNRVGDSIGPVDHYPLP